jgi:hypothetical protein
MLALIAAGYAAERRRGGLGLAATAVAGASPAHRRKLMVMKLRPEYPHASVGGCHHGGE